MTPNLSDLTAALDDYEHLVGNLYGDAEAPDERTTILWNRERYARLADGEFWLSGYAGCRIAGVGCGVPNGRDLGTAALSPIG